MRLGKYILTAAAATMAVAPAMAAPANSAASLSVSKSVRTGSASAKKNELAGGGIIVAVLAAAAVVAGIVIVADSDDNSVQLRAGAEGATAPETLRPKDHVCARALAVHLESDAIRRPPTG